MPVVFTAANASVSALASDIIRSALTEVGAIGAGESIQPEDLAWGLEKLQRQIDYFNSRAPLIFNVAFNLFALQANHSPHTIGPGGDFQLASRPVRILSASLVLTSSSPNIDIPIPVRDDDWWAANRIKALTSTLPTNLYYSADSPLGSCYFWPIPTSVNSVRLETWTALVQALSTNTAIGLPAAYWDALVYSVAVSLGPSFRQPSESLIAEHKRAMKAIEGNNDSSPRMSTQQAGMPGRGRKRAGGFNFLTGEPW